MPLFMMILLPSFITVLLKTGKISTQYFPFITLCSPENSAIAPLLPYRILSIIHFGV